MSKKKPLILQSPLTKNWYFVRSYKVIDEEKGIVEVTGKKEDITEQMLDILDILDKGKQEHARLKAENESLKQSGGWYLFCTFPTPEKGQFLAQLRGYESGRIQYAVLHHSADGYVMDGYKLSNAWEITHWKHIEPPKGESEIAKMKGD
jgi:hypothetical protein